MSPEGTRLLDNGVMVFDGHDKHPTLEGPKLYKRKGYYYIFAPAGGVEKGWQLVFRSKDIYGPYEERIVLAQGKTIVNGPHQGAWVDTPHGEDWFVHFQDKGPYGRIVHLQPMRWINDWPVMGVDEDGDGVGEPVLTYKKPNVGRTWPIQTPPDSDEFNAPRLGLQWQWQANPQAGWAFPTGSLGFLRLFNISLPEGYRNLFDVPNLLLQKFPAPHFTATTKVTFTHRAEGEKIGLIVMGLDYAYVGVTKKTDGLYLSQAVCKNVESGTAETEGPAQPVTTNTFYLRVQVSDKAVCRFSFSTNGSDFTLVGETFQARKGKWIGAKVGVFAVRDGKTYESGYADLDWFRVE
jgi:beta-xylosidase